jgi:short-subunit dehydrogenase
MITGASAGLGAAFARALGVRGYDLVLTARREQRLVKLAEELQTTNRITVEIVAGDLTTRSCVEELERRIRGDQFLVLLVNNAGFGVLGDYVEQPVNKHQRMIDVHVTATVRLSHAALPNMIRRGRGAIINVSSIAAFIPSGGGPGYCASKAYLNAFSTNLQACIPQGIRIQALCPGYTYTEFHNSPDYQGNEREKLPSWVWMTAEEVVEYSLRCLSRSKVIVVPGFKNQLIAFFLRSFLGEILMKWRGTVLKRR